MSTMQTVSAQTHLLWVSLLKNSEKNCHRVWLLFFHFIYYKSFLKFFTIWHMYTLHTDHSHCLLSTNPNSYLSPPQISFTHMGLFVLLSNPPRLTRPIFLHDHGFGTTYWSIRGSLRSMQLNTVIPHFQNLLIDMSLFPRSFTNSW